MKKVAWDNLMFGGIGGKNGARAFVCCLVHARAHVISCERGCAVCSCGNGIFKKGLRGERLKLKRPKGRKEEQFCGGERLGGRDTALVVRTTWAMCLEPSRNLF